MKESFQSEPWVVVVKGGSILVDKQDVEIACGFGWKIKNEYVMHFFRNSRTKTTDSLALHRLIAGTPPDMVTDHIDGNPRNNTRANLRSCTRAQNSANMQSHGRRGLTSRYKGVHRARREGKWVAMIGVAGKIRRIGGYATEEAAARAYDDAARKHFGEFGRYNFPREGEQCAL